MTSEDSMTESRDLLEEIRLELLSIDGMADFATAASGFIHGEVELEEATAVMTRFLRGDGYGDADERSRVIELAQTIEARSGFVAITVSISACTAAFSCSLACC
ncbi:hypothetical protein E1287_32210 [Actinomadura sp. KC06]|uniref:hypothetical protein n=1 Tax=Actinomadura sp. KC06 TaxID=2530369 RepID=UPI00104BE976|nr:hypothetical protein [Actinomadura sp. KC06]TDD28773.1 hypothetical protein E1287_32210 [Actinomadura sp. KC06]